MQSGKRPSHSVVLCGLHQRRSQVWCSVQSLWSHFHRAGDGLLPCMLTTPHACCYGDVVFLCQTKKSAGWLAGKMHQEGHAVALITGESTIEQRIAVLNRCIKYVQLIPYPSAQSSVFWRLSSVYYVPHLSILATKPSILTTMLSILLPNVSPHLSILTV